MIKYKIGHAGEKNARPIQIPIEEELAMWPDAVVNLHYTRPGATSPYVVSGTVADGCFCWTPSLTDTENEGIGSAQVIFTDNDNNLIGKTDDYIIEVLHSEGTAGTAPEGMQSWVDTLTALGATTTAKAAAAASSATAAAESASTARTKAGEASASASNALSSANRAQNKADEASSSASRASSSASSAATSANNALSSSTGAYNSKVAATSAATRAATSEANAAASATAAAASAAQAAASAAENIKGVKVFGTALTKDDDGVVDVTFGTGNEITGNYSFATGYKNKVYEESSNAEGFMNTVNDHAGSGSGENHAEGRKNTVSGGVTHVEGAFNTATNAFGVHVEGEGNTTNLCQDVHVEGSGNTTESTSYVHIEGLYNVANAGSVGDLCSNVSHVEGALNVAYGIQHVEGVNNIPDTTGQYLHIIGNGMKTQKSARIPMNASQYDDYRSNAHTVDWDGNAEFQGDVKANACGGENPISLVSVASDVETLRSEKISMPTNTPLSGKTLKVKKVNDDGTVDTEWAGDMLTTVKIASTSITTGSIATIPYASALKHGVVKVTSTNGVQVSSNGDLSIYAATDSNLSARNSAYRPIVPSNLNKAVKAALSDDNRISDMTSDEMDNACASIGAMREGAVAVATMDEVRGYIYGETNDE